jgi:GTPase SAR1 family protein
MGLCTSSLTDEERTELQESKKFDNVLEVVRQDDIKTIKLLLLGTGESGKSTIFKQMQILYETHGFTEYEKNTYRHVVRRNVTESMQTLIQGLDKFSIRLTHPKSAAAATSMLMYDPLAADFWSDDIVPLVKHLWNNESAIKEVYKNRAKLQLLDSAAYFFENGNLDRISNPNYTPSQVDILRARLRTSGIVERTFNIQNVNFKFLDVGGQRNERRKWIHCFEDVTAVIFVTAIQEYDQVLYEDEKENRLHEIDLFEDKIKLVNLNVCFPEYTGDNSLLDGAKYIEDRFVEVNEDKKRMIFPHLTCATDTQNVQKVFDACKVTILSNNLMRLGLT